ncbi:MAG: hypothetical protein EOO68_34350, partial [Moraxellaceae bacterium]
MTAFVKLIGASDQFISPNYTLLSGGWHHIAYTYEVGSQKLYVDGVVVASGTRTELLN